MLNDYEKLNEPKLPNDFTGIWSVSNSEKQFWDEGVLTRYDGPAIVHANGDKFYYRDFKLHRENGPAIYLTDGTRYFYKHGLLHNMAGPAVKTMPGSYTEYWIDGVKHTKKQYMDKLQTLGIVLSEEVTSMDDALDKLMKESSAKTDGTEKKKRKKRRTKEEIEAENNVFRTPKKRQTKAKFEKTKRSSKKK